MIGGVNFQPGSSDQEQQRRGMNPSGSNQGIQEAIKVLSLRLPKVVGAQAAAPSALLQSQGSNGNRRVDSIVQSVLSRFFPQAAPRMAGAAPMQPMPAMPQVESMRAPRVESMRAPRVEFGDRQPLAIKEPTAIDRADPSIFTPPQVQPPNNPMPDLRRQLDWLPSPDAGRSYNDYEI